MEWYKENEPTSSPFVVSGDVNCLSCGKMWAGKYRLGETTYKEDVE